MRSEPSRAEPEIDGRDVFDGAAVDWPIDTAATISVGTAAAQARTMSRLKRIVPFPLAFEARHEHDSRGREIPCVRRV